MTQQTRLDNDEKYQLMIRIFNTKTQEVVKEWRESCMFPNSKRIVRNAARKNGCYKVGKDLIRHSYAKLLIEDKPIQLDNDADHDLDDTSGTVWILIADDISVEIYFETDDRQNIELLSAGDAKQEINSISEDYAYTLQAEHEPAFRAIIDKYLYDNPVGHDDVERDTMESLGFTNSDFMYG